MCSLKKGSHTVIKNDDVFEHLSLSEREILRILLDKVENGRKTAGKKLNEYYICNTDEPYAAGVLQLILLGEERKAFCENIKDEKCSTRDYGPNQYKEPCYECCLGCAGAINMECNFVCTKVAEHYHPEDED
ncbi:MAG: hypothetical protein K0R92_538 [Lachnospiraceae bacterium]|jgi:hypothetical protein|nr:hypothetical protein [Lachnospiraceae bacterium]